MAVPPPPLPSSFSSRLPCSSSSSPVHQRYIDEFRVAQERARTAARDAELAEQRRIEAYNASRAGRAEAVAKAKAEDEAAKEAR
jgi:hypothetical protein